MILSTNWILMKTSTKKIIIFFHGISHHQNYYFFFSKIVRNCKVCIMIHEDFQALQCTLTSRHPSSIFQNDSAKASTIFSYHIFCKNYFSKMELRKEKFGEKIIIILVVADAMKKNNIFFGESFHQNPACGQNNFCHHILHFLIICLHAFNFLSFFKFAKN